MSRDEGDVKFCCKDRDGGCSVTFTASGSASSRTVALIAAQSFNENDGHGLIQSVGDKWISERIIDVTEDGFVKSFIVSVQHIERYSVRRLRERDVECEVYDPSKHQGE